MTGWQIAGCRLVIVGALALLWELSGRNRWIDPDMLPPLSKVLGVVGRLVVDKGFIADMTVTALECLVASAVVVPLGLLVGFALGESRSLERVLNPPLQLLMTVPKSIFLPVFILMLGIGFAQKVIFAVVLAFFIVVPTGMAAVQSVPPGLVLAARAFGATRAQIYTRIYLPAMAPVVIGGVRLGIIFAIHGVIFAEMYASSVGVGKSILTWGESFQMDYLFAAVLIVVGFTVALNEIMQAIENRARARFAAEART